MSRRQFSLDAPDPELLDDTGCHVLHVDMDAFYASVTLLEHPDLVGTPVIIGGGTRGVVLSATYEARRFGVASAMPMARARRLCPQATVLGPDHSRYAEVSRGVMAVFRSVTPLVEPLSVDEAFLDVAGAVRTHGRPAVIARRIRDAVTDEQGITCSVGVAPTKFVAKLASGLAKPDGLRVVPVDQVVPTLHQLPVGALWGVGDKTEEALLRLGLRTVADIAHTPRPTLQRALGQAMGASLHELAWGRDPRRVTPAHVEKSVGADETFAHDIDDPVEIHRHLLGLADRSTARLRSQGMVARTVSIKVRFADFTTITRARTLREHTDVGHEVYQVARELFDALGLQRARIRLVGVRLESLSESGTVSRQATLDEPEHGWRDAERAVDRASARFGAGVVRPASLVRGARSTATPPRDLS
ncbi:DNA polymerase IV [Arsenicicoccus sp. oral taxon 190]|uniref:DNA polymerase IV n=1 Tax=Arsenicicoccus sp. oral taxon 190 TaxID=1658671 RepID=UPI00067A308B|nr:DNA polymerase IV [Arsenicicoccus sp. oral taxon 190]AKT52031.1 DNA polymerase IV [Arsenicicoccus sp. oral taxon 190]